MEQTQINGTVAIPMGMAMSMAQNPAAMNAFCNLSDRRRAELVAKARAVRSRGEMERLIQELTVGR